MALTIANRNDLITALSTLDVLVAAEQGALDGLFTGRTSPESSAAIAALTPVATPDATDEATAITLVNALKVSVNAIIAALKA